MSSDSLEIAMMANSLGLGSAMCIRATTYFQWKRWQCDTSDGFSVLVQSAGSLEAPFSEPQCFFMREGVDVVAKVSASGLEVRLYPIYAR